MTMSSHSLDWDPISPTPKSACEVSFSGENVVTLEKGRVGFQRDFQGWHEIFVFQRWFTVTKAHWFLFMFALRSLPLEVSHGTL